MGTKVMLDVVTRLQDNGDGGYTCYLYNTEQELVDNHPMFEKFDMKKKKFYRVEPTEEEANIILDEEDPYENGYIGSESIALIVNKDGTVELDSSGHNSIHAGQ